MPSGIIRKVRNSVPCPSQTENSQLRFSQFNSVESAEFVEHFYKKWYLNAIWYIGLQLFLYVCIT